LILRGADAFEKNPRMRRLYWVAIGFFMATADFAATSSKNFCFENAGLKAKQKVTFNLANNQISNGKFITENYEDDTKKITGFSGSKTGTVLIVTFGKKAPYTLPPKTDVIIWKLEKNTLKIKTYGKNYETGKYSAYDMPMTVCEDATEK
jgi:hypothetical protein